MFTTLKRSLLLEKETLLPLFRFAKIVNCIESQTGLLYRSGFIHLSAIGSLIWANEYLMGEGRIKVWDLPVSFVMTRKSLNA